MFPQTHQQQVDISSQGMGGGLEDEGDKAMVTSVGKAPLSITNCVIGFGYASVRMTVHSFLPLEDRG